MRERINKLLDKVAEDSKNVEFLFWVHILTVLLRQNYRWGEWPF